MVTELALLHIYFINVRETEWAINTGQSRETGNNEDKKPQRNHSKICVGYHHTQGEDKHNTIFVFLRIFIDDVIA